MIDIYLLRHQTPKTQTKGLTFMMFPCLGIFLAFVLILSFLLSRTKQQEREIASAFLEREYAANIVRKKDLSRLSYIQVPLDSFEFGRHTEDDLLQTEDSLRCLSGKKILNLTGISNTDLKMSYGTANLEFLTECDTNCAILFKLLDIYATQLLNAKDITHAQLVLEYAINIHSDVGNSYLSLAKIYASNGDSHKAEMLATRCSHFDSYRQKSLKDKLLAIAQG